MNMLQVDIYSWNMADPKAHTAESSSQIIKASIIKYYVDKVAFKKTKFAIHLQTVHNKCAGTQLFWTVWFLNFQSMVSRY